MRKVFIASVFFIAASLAPSMAADLTPQQKKAVDEQIETYFIRNPDKLEQALTNMQAYMGEQARLRQQAAMDENADSLYRNAGDYSMGPKDAPITIVEFFDYNCGYCKRSFAPLMEVLRDNKDVRLVFKEYPILGEESSIASGAALAIEDNLQYLTYHSKLMTHQGRINQPVIDKTLSDMKLSPGEIGRKANKAQFQTHLIATRELADAIGVSGTPAFVINGALFAGALERTELNAAIKQARANLKDQ